MRYFVAVAAVLAALTAMPQSADAATARTTTKLALRAGPDTRYPVIARLGGNSYVNVISCVNGYRWCDVSAGGLRGWTNGNYLRSNYRNRSANVISLGSILGLPIVTYNERDYWGRHYYDRDFYKTRYGWRDNDARHYGWVKTNGRWEHSKNWRDTDHDGIPNKYDRDDDNDGRNDRHDRDDDNDGIRDRYDHNQGNYYDRSHWGYRNGHRYND